MYAADKAALNHLEDLAGELELALLQSRIAARLRATRRKHFTALLEIARQHIEEEDTDHLEALIEDLSNALEIIAA
jgi:hypothetical protein